MNNELLTIARWHLQNAGKLPWGELVTAALLGLLNDKLGYLPPGAVVEHFFPIAPLPDGSIRPKIALCLGHGRAGDEGAVSVDGTSEEEFNIPLIHRVEAMLKGWGYEVMTVMSYQGANYPQAMRWLAEDLKKLGATCAVEFHFNASAGKTRGHEVLHWSGSQQGVRLAGEILDQLNRTFPDEPDRGLKAKTAADRGALFLSLTHCPACIVEPFFGDNAADWQSFSGGEGFEKLAQSYAHGIANFCEKGRAA